MPDQICGPWRPSLLLADTQVLERQVETRVRPPITDSDIFARFNFKSR